MKIYAVNGGPRKKHNTAKLLQAALSGAAAAPCAEAVETEMIHLYDLDFQGCMSCFACKRLGAKSYGRCGFKDALSPVLEKLSQADGIISTRPNIIRRAKALGMLAIQRFFLFDSLSFENVLRLSPNADAVDLLPGTMPRVLERLKPQIRQPIIASGLLADKQDVVAALSAGAQAVSTTKPELWEI